MNKRVFITGGDKEIGKSLVQAFTAGSHPRQAGDAY